MAKVEIKKYCNLVFVQRAKKLSWMAGHQNRNLMRSNWDGSQWKCYLFSFNWLRLRLCSYSLIANSKTPKLCGGQSGSFWAIVTCIAKYFMMNNLWLLIFFSTLRIKFYFVDSFYLTWFHGERFSKCEEEISKASIFNQIESISFTLLGFYL